MNEIPERLWTILEFAEWLRVSPWAVRAMLRRRQIPPEAVVKIGRRVRIRVEVVRHWLPPRQAV